MVDIKLKSAKSADENNKQLGRSVAFMTFGCPSI